MTPEINKKSAPQREVLEIIKTGNYGTVVYSHRLSCGHTEKRKRKASAKYIACTLCAVAIKASKELGTLKTASTPKPVLRQPPEFDEIGSDLGNTEISTARLTADLAAAFKISNEMISIVFYDDDDGNLSVGGATIWLDYEAMNRVLAERRSSVSEDEYRIRRPLGNQ